MFGVINPSILLTSLNSPPLSSAFFKRLGMGVLALLLGGLLLLQASTVCCEEGLMRLRRSVVGWNALAADTIALKKVILKNTLIGKVKKVIDDRIKDSLGPQPARLLVLLRELFEETDIFESKVWLHFSDGSELIYDP
jgi:hypothetical protein